MTQYDQVIATETGLFIQGKEQIPEEYRSLMTFPEYNGRDYNLSGSYPVGQCTWYVFNRVSQLGGQVDDYMGNGGQWGNTGRRLGYNVSQTPKAGSMISFAAWMVMSLLLKPLVQMVFWFQKEMSMVEPQSLIA